MDHPVVKGYMLVHVNCLTCMRKLKSMRPPTTVMAVLMREEGWPTETPPLKPPRGVLRPALNPAAALAS